jgi:hypothetical protein
VDPGCQGVDHTELRLLGFGKEDYFPTKWNFSFQRAGALEDGGAARFEVADRDVKILNGLDT